MADDLEYRAIDLHIAKLRVEPGDMLVIKVNERLRAETLTRIREHAALVLGGVAPVLVIDSGMDISVLTKAEIDARPA